jgi:hypothetical protein
MASSKASRQTLLGALGFQNSRAETSATSSSGAFDLARCGGCPQKPSGSASRGQLSRCR